MRYVKAVIVVVLVKRTYGSSYDISLSKQLGDFLIASEKIT